jgi:hypothetical protein
MILEFLMKNLGLITASLAAAGLIACGGGGGGSSDITSQFIDSPVQGLYYSSTSGKTGTTDAGGNFTVKSGDTVTFKIGGKDGLEIGSATPTKDAPVLVTDLPGGMQVAQILQSLDLGGDSSTKLDLSQIISLPPATVTALSDHIKSGNLTDGQTILATAQAAIKSAIPALAAKTFPTPPDAAAINKHILASTANISSPRIPALDGKAYILVQNSDGTDQKFGLIGFKDGKVKYFTTETGVATGKYAQSGDKLTITFDSYQKRGASVASTVSCVLSSTMKKFDDQLPGAFQVSTAFSGNDCPSSTVEIDTFAAIDQTPTLDGFKGKTFTLNGATSLSSKAGSCDTITWTFADLALSSSTTSSNFCGGFKFGDGTIVNKPTVKIFSADAPYIFTANFDYGSGGLEGSWIITKLANVENTALLMWVSNFDPPTSSNDPTPTVDTKNGMQIRKAIPMKFSKQ